MTKRLIILLVGLALALSGCGLGTAGGFSPTGTLSGPLADVPRLRGATVRVGSKNFTEQLILGKIAVILLQSAGATVDDLTNIPGSASMRQAALSYEVTMNWEYTGTAWIAYMGRTEPIPDEQEQYEAVRDEDAGNGLVWLPPAPMNNTYGFAAKSAVAEELGVTTLSGLADIPKEERTLCVESEFTNRNDGLEPMLETYGIPLGSGVTRDQLNIMETGAIYAGVDRGVCNFGEVFTTDGRIKALDLVVLEDDRQYFPKYNVSPVFAAPLIEEYPHLADLFTPVAGELTSDTLIGLNAQVDVDGREPVDVAWDWLVSEGFVQET